MSTSNRAPGSNDSGGMSRRALGSFADEQAFVPDGPPASFRFVAEITAAIEEWKTAIGQGSGLRTVRLKRTRTYTAEGFEVVTLWSDRHDARAIARSNTYGWTIEANVYGHVLRDAARDAERRWR